MTPERIKKLFTEAVTTVNQTALFHYDPKTVGPLALELFHVLVANEEQSQADKETSSKDKAKRRDELLREVLALDAEVPEDEDLGALYLDIDSYLRSRP